MKKIGIIDYYISNYHSNTYHEFFHKIAEEENREEYVITHVFAIEDMSPSTNETTAEWCARTGAKQCATIEELCDAVDVIMILSPNHPQFHEEFAKVAFKSGKRVYVDKTFAPDYATAKRIVDCGKENGAEFWSTSATRFDPEILEFLNDDKPRMNTVTAMGGNVFDVYCIHLVELVNTFIKNGAKSVICRNGAPSSVFEITYNDGRKAFINHYEKAVLNFTCLAEIDGTCKKISVSDDIWKNCTRALMDFFDTGVIPVSNESTLECMAILSAMKTARENVGKIVNIEG